MMKRFILGFQRRVWCPKWTPLSRSWRMVTTAMPCPPGVSLVGSVGGARVWPPAWRLTRTPPDAVQRRPLRGKPDQTGCASPFRWTTGQRAKAREFGHRGRRPYLHGMPQPVGEEIGPHRPRRVPPVSEWLPVLPPLVLCVAIVLVPGAGIAYAVGLRGIAAWGVAPSLGTTLLAGAAVLAPFMHLPWQPWLLVAAAALAVLLAYLLGFAV